jgi:hypothetical protein
LRTQNQGGAEHEEGTPRILIQVLWIRQNNSGNGILRFKKKEVCVEDRPMDGFN